MVLVLDARSNDYETIRAPAQPRADPRLRQGRPAAAPCRLFSASGRLTRPRLDSWCDQWHQTWGSAFNCPHVR